MNNFKKIVISLLIFFAIAGFEVSFAAPETVKVIVNGNQLVTDTPAVIRDSRTMVPFRALFEALGMRDITWDEPTQKVTGSDGKTKVELIIGSYDIYVNGNPVTMDTVPVIIDSRTMIPLSFVAKNMGADVKWDGINYVATVTQNTGQIPSQSDIFDNLGGKYPSGQVIGSSTILDGYYAMEDLFRKKYVLSFASGYVDMKSVDGGVKVKGTYIYDGTNLKMNVGNINGNFTKEDVNYAGKNILFMKDNANPNAGQTFAMIKTTKEEFDKYSQK